MSCERQHSSNVWTGLSRVLHISLLLFVLCMLLQWSCKRCIHTVEKKKVYPLSLRTDLFCCSLIWCWYDFIYSMCHVLLFVLFSLLMLHLKPRDAGLYLYSKCQKRQLVWQRVCQNKCWKCSFDTLRFFRLHLCENWHNKTQKRVNWGWNDL